MFDVTPGAKIWSKLPSRSGTYVVKTSLLANARRPAGLRATNRATGIREGIARGFKFGAIRVTRGARGGLTISDGNNRLRVARERGEKFVKVRISR